jgi:hypothetical protein
VLRVVPSSKPYAAARVFYRAQYQTPEVTLADLAWGSDNRIRFSESVFLDDQRLKAREATFSGVSTIRDFGSAGTSVLSLGGDRWLIANEDGLWLQLGHGRVKLASGATEPAWLAAAK